MQYRYMMYKMRGAAADTQLTTQRYSKQQQILLVLSLHPQGLLVLLANARKVLHNVQKRGNKVTNVVSLALSGLVNSVENFLSPSPEDPACVNLEDSRYLNGGILLHSCSSVQEHIGKIQEDLKKACGLKGLEGLLTLGFEYRLVECGQHDKNNGCHSCATRLFHIKSNTMIDQDNRRQFIADGDMYDVVTELCQETAHEIMQRDYGLVWVTIWEDSPNSKEPREPIRALVNRHHPLALEQERKSPLHREERNAHSRAIPSDEFAQRPTLLIATGKGKVRAGLFSRKHLLVSGIEVSTAIPLLKEANHRRLNVVVIDPNVHGDRLAMTTFERSMSKLFQTWEEKQPSSRRNQSTCSGGLYILSHSASGGQLARYLLDKSAHYLPHIRAIAFTDSTHNIRWAKENENLRNLLEGPACVYFRCSNEDRDGDECAFQRAGDELETDIYWERRFGKIRTCWAGTTEHSLTNWFAHSHIWDHFDNFLK